MASEAPEPKRRKTANDNNEKRQRVGEDNPEEPERKKRHVDIGIRQCGCSCATGIIELDTVAFQSSHIPNLKCRCTMCGPIGDNGGRRCPDRIYSVRDTQFNPNSTQVNYPYEEPTTQRRREKMGSGRGRGGAARLATRGLETANELTG